MIHLDQDMPGRAGLNGAAGARNVGQDVAQSIVGDHFKCFDAVAQMGFGVAQQCEGVGRRAHTGPADCPCGDGGDKA